MRLVAAVLMALAASGCAHKFVELPLVSMTKSDPPPGALKEVPGVTGKYCIGDPPKATKGSIIGLVDEATLNAQTKHHVDYLTDAVYTKEGGFFSKLCVTVAARGLGKGGR